MIDYQELKRLAEAARYANASFVTLRDFSVAASPAAMLAMFADLEGYQQCAKAEADAADEARAEVRKLNAEVEVLTAEVERLKLYAEAEAKGADRAGKALCVSAKEMREIRAELHCVSMENESLKASNLYWVSKPGSGLIRCVPDARYRKFAPSIRARYEPVRVIDVAMSKESGQ